MSRYAVIRPKAFEQWAYETLDEAEESARRFTLPDDDGHAYIACIVGADDTPVAFYWRGVRYVPQKGIDDSDDALWDESFANSQEFLAKLSDEIKAQYEDGLTEDFDPDTDPDLRPSFTYGLYGDGDKQRGGLLHRFLMALGLRR